MSTTTTATYRRSVWIDDHVDPMDTATSSFCATCGLYPLTVAEAEAHTCR